MVAILAAALDVARGEGRDALTVQRVAERVDMTAGALYRYFPSKDALVAELQRTVIEWLGETTRARVDGLLSAPGVDVESDADRALLAVLVTALSFEDFAAHAPVEFGLLSMYLTAPEFALPDDEAARVFGTAVSNLEELAGHLERAAELGAIEPGIALDRAIALWAGLQGVVQTRKLARSAGGTIDPTRIAIDLVDSLLVGWGGRREDVVRLSAIARDVGFTEPIGSLDLERQITRH